ncbi:MAG TPA: glycosyltransferase family 4 protein [Nitrospiraceae bacterium]|nr:glycosyltransferase family 4 protein [Nitrospiraceae bacterium]
MPYAETLPPSYKHLPEPAEQPPFDGERGMRVVHLSTYDVIGGAGRAAYRIHSGLREAGIHSSMFVREARTKDQSVITFDPSQTLYRRVARRIRREQIQRKLHRSVPAGNRKFEPFRYDRSEYGTDVIAQIPDCDVVNLHWVVDFVDYPSFFESLPERKRVVWTLHDMNPFTGGCHYDLGCGRHLTRCHQCPQLQSQEDDDLSAQIWDRKKVLFERIAPSRLHIATPSSWLAEEVKRSPLLNRFPVTVIPNGINLEDFAPRNKQSARDVFGIPQQSKVVLFVADGLPLYRKGFGVLAEALERVGQRIPNVCLVCVGHNDPPPGLRVPWIHLGYVGNDRLLSNIYSAADVFVIPSFQDNLPNTVLESMACGTPVAGFSVGGIPDMVQHGKTGLLAPPFDALSLGTAITELLKNTERRLTFSSNCRRVAVHRFSVARQAVLYYELYKNVLQYDA